MNSSIPYYKDPNEATKDAEKICYWLGSDKEILELGCHSGYYSSWISKNNCRITGVDINNKALELAMPYLKAGICYDIEDIGIWNNFKKDSFDVILLMHIIEHLKSPESVLKKAVEYLKTDGLVIVGLPNICNAKDRFNITFGRFEYTEIGVMDITHLRFFNFATAYNLINKSGLIVEDYYSPWQVNPLREFFDHIPVLWRVKKIFSNKPPVFPHFSQNLTDVVMLFKCRLK